MKKLHVFQHWPQFWLSPQVLPVAATSTVTGGYAQSDAQGQMNKMGGFNLKYRYEEDNSPLGVIGSFTYTEKSRTASSGDYNKTSTTASLLVRLTALTTGQASTV